MNRNTYKFTSNFILIMLNLKKVAIIHSSFRTDDHDRSYVKLGEILHVTSNIFLQFTFFVISGFYKKWLL